MKQLQVIVLLVGFLVIPPGDPRNPNSVLAQNLTPISPPASEDELGKPFLPAEPLGIAVEELQATLSSVEAASRLEIRLTVRGHRIEKALGFRCALIKAVDDTGADLRRAEENLPAFNMFGPTLRVKLPSRKATVLKELSGVVEVFCPHRDPQATVNLANFVGKPRVELSHPSLTANRVTLTILSKAEFDRIRGQGRSSSEQPAGGQNVQKATQGISLPFGAAHGLTKNSVVVLQGDPNHRVVSMSFVTRVGVPIASSYNEAGVFFDGGVPQAYSAYSFDSRLPETTVMRIVLATRKAVVAIPFSLKDIPLP
jgi:hypothetical protein